MKVFKIIKLTIFLIISLVIMIPAWYTFLDRRHVYCSVEEFNAGKHSLNNHVTITGNALFKYAYRYEELSSDTLYNVSYYVPLVDSLWSIDKPIKTMLQFESGKMAFDSGFTEAVGKMDKEMDSLSKSKSNRLTFTGNNKIFEFSKLEDRADDYFKNTAHLKISSNFSISKIVVREHFSMFGFVFITIFTVVIGFLLYYFAKPIFKRRKQSLNKL